MLTLSSFQGGMTPVDETVSAADGTFAFQKDLPAVASGQQFRGAIRTEQDGVGYTEILPSGASLEDIEITVYSASGSNLPAPSVRLMVFEPSGAELIIQEIYQFVNDSDPPVTYSSEAGTLQFHLAPAANGVVQVSGTGPAGMPLRSTELPTSEPDVYKVDFPLKPGDSQIGLTYVVPYEDGTVLLVRNLYRGVPTRVAAPEGVQLDGDIRPLGQHPETRASIYEIPDEDLIPLKVTGQGSFPSRTADASAAPAEITIEPAPVADEILWIVTISTLILGLSFCHLLTSKRAAGHGDRADGPAQG